MGKFIVGINEKTNFKQIETINNIENRYFIVFGF